MEITKQEILTKTRSKGEEMHDLITELYPICRSITGDGVRQTINILKKHIPLSTHKIRTGAAVFDWEVVAESIPSQLTDKTVVLV